MDRFTYLHQLRVFVCCLCQQVVSPSHIEDHIRLRGNHGLQQDYHRLPEFREFFQRYPEQLLDINRLTIPTVPIKVLPQLAPPRTGLRCQSDPDHCPYICCDVRTIQKHCHTNHSWKPPRKRGRPRKRTLSPSKEGSRVPWKIVAAQQFQPKGRLSRYFEVLGGPQAVASSADLSPDQQYAEKKRLIQDRVQAVMDSQHQSIPDGHRTEVNPWLDMVGWPSHLQAYQHHRKELLAFLEIPPTDRDHEHNQNETPGRARTKKRRIKQACAAEAPGGLEQLFNIEDRVLGVICGRKRSTAPGALDNLDQLFNIEDRVLGVICASFDEIIRVGQHTVMEKVNWSVRFEINRKEQAKAERRPFHARLLDSTMTRYRYVWKQLICYVVRSTVQQQREKEQVEEVSSQGDNDEPFLQQPRFTLTPPQQILYDEMWQCCRSSLELEHEQGRAVNEEATPSYTLQPAQQAVLRFLISLLDHQIRGNEFENGILSGLAVLGLDPNQGWIDALNYTPKLSAVVKLARIMVVQQAWELCKCSSDLTPSCFDEVQKSVRRFMVIDQPVPMSRIYHIRTYGLKIRYTTTADGRVDWIGQGKQSRLLLDGIEFTKEQFEAMVRGLLYEC
jgi:Orsellinic acid/F9775 biosynthesis cluster protein D